MPAKVLSYAYIFTRRPYFVYPPKFSWDARILSIRQNFHETPCIAPVVWSFLSTTAQLYVTHRRGSGRRKRHVSKCTGMRPWWRGLRRLRVTGHVGRVVLSRHTPPSHSTFPWTEISDFQEKRLKKYDSLFLETQKWYGWIRTAFVILYKLEWKW